MSHFSVSAHLLRLLPRSGISLRNPDLRPPLLRLDPNGGFLEMRVEGDSRDPVEFGLVRRLSLDRLSPEEIRDLRSAVELLDWGACAGLGVSQGLAAIETRRWERWLTSLLTFGNTRQMALLLVLYRIAHARGSVVGAGNAGTGSGISIEVISDEVLTQLGYTRTKDGGFASKLRSQIHRDLVTLHRLELVYPRGVALGQFGETGNRTVEVRSVLKILDAVPERSSGSFDIFRAADFTYEMADRYTLQLNFFDREMLSVLANFDLSQRLGGNAKNDYRMRLMMYLASRVAWGNLSDGQYLILSKALLFKNLDLLGSNSSRNNQIFWRTIEQLKQDHILVSAQELPGRDRLNSIQFQIDRSAFMRSNG